MAERDKKGRFPKGNGPGWGGPAKGASDARIKPGDPDGITKLRHRPEAAGPKLDAREKVLAMYEGFVDDPAVHPMVRIAAGDKLLDRLEGKPVARTLTANVSDPSQLSDADLAAIAAGGRAAPDAPQGDPPEPGEAIH